MTSLPHELYRLIVENTSSLSDLCVMARVSHNMRPEAERLIWRDVSLRGDDKFFQVFTVIRPTSNIWLYITTLVLEDAHQNEQYRPTFYNTIATVLQRMKNLRDLTLYFMRGSITSTAYCYSWPFERNIRFPFNLRSFHGAFLIEEKLFSFLETQPNLLLVDLWMGSRSNTYFPPALFTPSILPNLRVLDAKNVRFPSPHILPAILSGRSITHLAIYSLDERNLRALEPVASSIKALKMASPPSQSLGLALVFPNLDHIGLYFLEKQESVMYDTISPFQHLKYLDLINHGALTMKIEHGTVLRLYNACSTLVAMSFYYPFRWPRGGRLWRKGEDGGWTSTVIQRSENLWSMAVAELSRGW